MKARAAAAAFALVACAARAELSPVEARIAAHVKERTPAALELLERSVRVNSGTFNLEGVREVGRVFADELRALGFDVRWDEMPPEMKRAGHLVATRKGTRGKRILLIGHLDTVFEPSSKVVPWERRGARVRGQGVSDMKGGDVIVLEALRALQREGALDGATISVIFTGDEERTGAPRATARASLVALGRESDVALAFEGMVVKQGRDTATVARRASSGWHLEVTGKPGHSAGVFDKDSGYGAIYEGARILNAFREKLPEENLTFNPGIVVGGSDARLDRATASGTAFGKSNVIASHFEATGDLRYLDTAQRDRVHRGMRDIVAASLNGAKAEITFGEAYPPMPPTVGNLRLLEQYSRASVDAGLGPVEALAPGERGAGDIQWVAPYADCLDGLGADGDGAHTDDEDLDIASIERNAVRAALLIYRLTR